MSELSIARDEAAQLLEDLVTACMLPKLPSQHSSAPLRCSGQKLTSCLSCRAQGHELRGAPRISTLVQSAPEFRIQTGRKPASPPLSHEMVPTLPQSRDANEEKPETKTLGEVRSVPRSTPAATQKSSNQRFVVHMLILNLSY